MNGDPWRDSHSSTAAPPAFQLDLGLTPAIRWLGAVRHRLDVAATERQLVMNRGLDIQSVNDWEIGLRQFRTPIRAKSSWQIRQIRRPVYQTGGFDIPNIHSLGITWKVIPVVTLALAYQQINYGGVKSIADSSLSVCSATNPLAWPATDTGCLCGSNGMGARWRNVDIRALGTGWQYRRELDGETNGAL